MSKELVLILKYLPTVVLVGITWWYARSAHKALQHAKEDSTAHVHLRLTLDQKVVYITIQNTGKLPARDINIKLLCDEGGIKPFRKYSLQELPFLRESINYLPPGDGYRYRIGHLETDKIKAENPKLGFRIEYKNGISEVKDIVEFKLSDYLEVIQRSFMDPYEMIVGALRGIQTELQDKSFTKGIMNSLGSKQCPYCLEYVPSTAKKCKHCLEWLPEDNDKENGQNGEA